ncbi:MAG TPA: HD-GYP domain-containing protein [Solirubrobacteraceae bacterium]|nr:HD-GYP domain-containing protein [Solirubrobacteraceae bacterium]
MLAALIPTLLIAVSGTGMFMVAPWLHIVVVGAAASFAMAASVVMSAIAMRRNDVQALWLGMGFSVMATLLLIHALATPGMILPMNGLVQVAGTLNLPIGGALLAASGVSALRRPRLIKLLFGLQLAVVGELALAGALILVAAPAIPIVPAPSSLAANLIFALGASPLALLAWRAARTYLLTRRPTDLIVANGVVWLIGAQYGLLHFGMMQAGFWAAHILEVGGIAMVAVPAALDLRHAVGSRPLAGDLRASDLVEHEEAFLGGRVRAILVRLGEKDPSTEGHTRRVALLAVAIGERLGLPEGRLRQLALGGLLHDVGKLSVPNEILNKPGRLTDEEFTEIRRHPGAGRELLSELGGFPGLVLELVESHHERLDGDGYPNHVAAAELDLAVRILTVADVYDALTADRVYREAWPSERALALLDDESGRAFDPECVAALRELVVIGQPGLGRTVARAEQDPARARVPGRPYRGVTV